MQAKTTKHKTQTTKPVSSGPALLAQILEALEDDAPRLVYADWLEEQGHPFADVIRLQLAGKKKPASALITRHRKQWVAPLGAWVDDPVFERGMIRRIYGKTNAYAQKATQALLLGAATTFGVRSTMLRGPCKKLGGAETLAWTPDLFWWDCQLDDAQFAELADSPHLARLSSLTLEKVRAGDAGLKAFAKASLPRLRHFALPSPVHLGKYSSSGILAVLDRLPITSLALTGVNALDVNKVVASQRVSKLSALTASTKYVRAIASSPHLVALETLRIASFESVEDADVKPLLDNPALGSLTSVYLQLLGQNPNRTVSAPMVARLRKKFGEGFTYATSGS